MAGFFVHFLIIMHRFFIDKSHITESSAQLTGPEAHHLRNVLRLSPGTQVELYDGEGNAYLAEITKIGNQTGLAIISKSSHTSPQPHLHIAQGILKGKKMDLIIQKATELGVSRFTPFDSIYTAVRPPKTSKFDRWQKIMLEACKQCGRPLPLTIDATQSFDNLLGKAANTTTKIIFWEKETSRTLHDFDTLSKSQSIIAMIGPEGGFSDQEIEQAVKSGFTPTSMGQQTLRAETASISAMAVLQFLSGNL